MYDVIIIGGGPAGLSAALVLGRCRRKVLVLDAGKPRNAASRALHGYLTRDGVAPAELRLLGRKDLEGYSCVETRDTTVVDVNREVGRFEVRTEDGQSAASRMLLLATGRVDQVPQKPGFDQYYGRGVYHCPYCDGWENRDRRLGVYGGDENAAGLALELLTWSQDITVFTDGEPTWKTTSGKKLEAMRIKLDPRSVEAAAGDDERLTHLWLAKGISQPCDAIFFCTNCDQASSLPRRLGCLFDDDDAVLCDEHAATGVPGLYVAGNVRGGLHLAITAAAEGAEAAVAINDALLDAAGASK